jgi:hypothetical protein
MVRFAPVGTATSILCCLVIEVMSCWKIDSKSRLLCTAWNKDITVDFTRHTPSFPYAVTLQRSHELQFDQQTAEQHAAAIIPHAQACNHRSLQYSSL